MGRLISANRCAIARPVAEIFFPQRPELGLHQRNYSPLVWDKIVSANAEHKSATKAQKMLWKLSEIKVSVPQILEMSGEIGQELGEHLQKQADAHADQTLMPRYPQTPNCVAVSPDGGRIMTRAEAGRGIHDHAWKETKNACLMTMTSTTLEEDPHPELPRCFSDRNYVEQLVREIHSSTTAGPENVQENASNLDEAETATDSPAAPAERQVAAVPSDKKWRPTRLVRTCVSSMACSEKFGPLVAGEAQRRGFYQAARRAFLGDGQAWNWTLHEDYFPNFVPIADFVHPLGYIYDAAKAIAPLDHWSWYLQATTLCWQGRVAEVLRQLNEWQARHSTPTDTADNDPQTVIQATITYLEHNQARMDYPRYRRQGLPVSTSMIESLIKEINYRVKGTEKFWNRPDGAEQILNVRAAALCDDDRLSQWILNRPGSLFHRRSTNRTHELALAG
jgi:hypothetical protein